MEYEVPMKKCCRTQVVLDWPRRWREKGRSTEDLVSTLHQLKEERCGRDHRFHSYWDNTVRFAEYSEKQHDWFDGSKALKVLRMLPRSGGDFGWPAEHSLEEIYRRARERGLDVCPAWVGPQLRLDYADQPVGEVLMVAMDPIPVTDKVLQVQHEEPKDGLQSEERRLAFWRGLTSRGQWIFQAPP